ncbi:major pollen allergen Ole e 10-like [Zingiber officinale]|uniref:major pollen allergen Ole e 10-like n=1 Tax=Zingiber officinale TaxID=94328 RepID=UPI001C4D8202|nr:major pollen allergen Ole e 10-like [Zingiber officinale]
MEEDDVAYITPAPVSPTLHPRACFCAPLEQGGQKLALQESSDEAPAKEKHRGKAAALAATISSGRGPWCVAKPEAPREVLQANIEYVCGGAIGDCSAIQEGASCYSTDIVRQASYAMNSFYYAKGGHRSINCFFNETGTKVRDDPSYGNCVYPS